MGIAEGEDPVRETIRTVLSGVSNLCIIPMQDWLGLEGEARMNFPGTLSDSNWTWRQKDDIMFGNLAETIRRMTALYGR